MPRSELAIMPDTAVADERAKKWAQVSEEDVHTRLKAYARRLRYRLASGSASDACRHNAQVATELGDVQLAQVRGVFLSLSSATIQLISWGISQNLSFPPTTFDS